MCTAVIYQNRYFGRNLDYEHSFGEEFIITEREFPFLFPEGKIMRKHHGIMGIGCVSEGYPLYFDAMNEKGLAMAGLLFSGNAVYNSPAEGKDNIPSWAFIPWVLGQCDSVEEAEELMQNLNLTDVPFSESLPPSELHWMIADRKRAIVVEQTEDGLHIYENGVGVLTNNPIFPFHLENLKQYRNLTAAEADNRFSKELNLHPFSRGMGAIGLPGDWSSASRFVRGAFVRANSVAAKGSEISQFFHILSSVEMPRGCVHLDENLYEMTIYSSCYDLEKKMCFLRLYETADLETAYVRKVGHFAETLAGSRLQRLQIV